MNVRIPGFWQFLPATLAVVLSACATQRPPDLPACADPVTTGCSVPRLLRLGIDQYDDYAGFFHRSCSTHDFCYRFGYKTYGHEQSDCDTRFLNDMQAQCRADLELNPIRRATCHSMARQFYEGVALKGGAAFQRQTGDFCEYDGQP